MSTVAKAQVIWSQPEVASQDGSENASSYDEAVAVYSEVKSISPCPFVRGEGLPQALYL